MDAELRQALVDLETNIGRRFDAKLEHLETRFDAKVEGLETRFDAKLEDLNRHFEERLEATETKLLTAFHGWAGTYESRSRGTAAVVRELDERMGIIEDRVARIERGRNGSADKH